MNSVDFENNPLIEKSRIKIRTQFFAAFAASLGGFALGTVLSYTSPAIPSLITTDQFSSLSLEQISWFASMAPLGSVFPGPFIGMFTENLGRKATLLLLNLPMLIGWILIGVGNNLWMLCGGRFLCGFAGGAFSVVVIIYINETALESVRGRLGLLNIIAIPSGMSFTYIAGCFLSYDYLALFLSSVPIIMFILMLFVVESPRFYLCKGMTNQARSALIWLRCDKDVREELELMQAHFLMKREQAGSCMDIFSSSATWKPMLACMGLLFFLSASGIDTVIFYGQSIFEDSGTSISPSISTVGVGLVSILSIALSVFAIDRFGRKPLMFLSEITMALSLGILGLFFYYSKKDSRIVEKFEWIPLLTLTIYTFGFWFGMGSVPYVYLEVIPSHVAGLVAGIAVCFDWGTGFLITHLFGTLKQGIGIDGTFWLFSGFCLLGVVFIWFCVPETKGKTLEELQHLFQ